MGDPQNFSPDWATTPGETISDILRKNGWSPSELARRTGQSLNAVQQLLNGQDAIGSATADALASALGGSASFWLAREHRYRDAVRRLETAWLDELPIDDMVKFGWIPEEPNEMTAGTVLRFFDVPSIQAWRANYRALERAVAYRMSVTFSSHPAAVAAWLRQGEIQARELQCGPWDRERFVDAFPAIRQLTRLRHPEHFLPKLQAVCAECGVAVVIVRAPDGCRASGAARFLSDALGVIQLSFRYLTDDHFWFTVFHEAGHLVLHADRGLYLEGVEPRSPKDEEEANQFAAQSLILESLQSSLRSLRPRTFDVLRFASRAGIAPGIVVGQLQHLGIVRQNQLNRLKRRFHWESSGTLHPRKAK